MTKITTVLRYESGLGLGRDQNEHYIVALLMEEGAEYTDYSSMVLMRTSNPGEALRYYEAKVKHMQRTLQGFQPTYRSRS